MEQDQITSAFSRVRKCWPTRLKGMLNPTLSRHFKHGWLLHDGHSLLLLYGWQHRNCGQRSPLVTPRPSLRHVDTVPHHARGLWKLHAVFCIREGIIKRRLKAAWMVHVAQTMLSWGWCPALSPGPWRLGSPVVAWRRLNDCLCL